MKLLLEIHGKLCKQFMCINLSSKLYLLRKMYSLKLAEGGDMIDHIVKFLERADKLKNLRKEMQNPHLSALLLCFLSPSYDTLITSGEARPEEELNSEFIKGKLTDEFQRRTESSNLSYENAYRALKSYRKKTYPKRDQNQFCTYCRRNNHTESNCCYLKNKNPKNQTNNGKQRQNSSLSEEMHSRRLAVKHTLGYNSEKK